MARGRKEPPQGVDARQRHVAVQDQRRHGVQQMRQRLHDGVAGAQLWFLARQRHCASPAARRVRSLEICRHGVTAVAVHDADGAGGRFAAQRLGRVEHVRQQRPAGQWVQHLGQVGVHALALPGGENDDVHGCFQGLGVVAPASARVDRRCRCILRGW